MSKRIGDHGNRETVETRTLGQLALDYDSFCVGRSTILRADCLEWLSRMSENSIHAIVTDPPYGLEEYEFQTGGLRRNPKGLPFGDVISSERTPRRERDIAEHPNLKPQP